MNQDREARKKALEAAKERLAFRRKQKEQLQLLRQQKQSGGGTGFDNQQNQNNIYRKNDYGKKLIDDTKQIINGWSATKEKEEKKLSDDMVDNDNLTNNTKQIVPGPRADLNIVRNVNVIDLMRRSRVEYVKEIQTDSVEIGQHSKCITEETDNNELNEILATFIENDINPWPNRKDAIYGRITISNRDEEKKEEFAEERESEPAETEKEEIFILSNDAATKLISSSTFISSFRNRSQILEQALGINCQHSIFIEAHSTIRDISENSEMEKLIKSAEISSPFTNGRAITCLDYDKNFGNRFLASYSGSIIMSSSSDSTQQTEQQKQQQIFANNIQSDGLINIFDCDSDYSIIKSLECQSMINCVCFHPTKENMIIGASVSGQVLGWNLRLNKKTPTIRTEFSSSSHTQPIFALKFLPSMNNYMPSSKIQQILTLSNDAKLCVWRDDMLYNPNNEFLLKLNNSNGPSSTNPKEITTTCFSYPSSIYQDNNNNNNNDDDDNKNNVYNSNNNNINKLWLGSDEGCIYETNLNLNKNDQRELLITSYINGAHYGPITCIDFHSISSSDKTLLQNGLYLTSSFDWTVKLWHISSSKPLALFNTMQDYVYDVKWSPTNPSIFAAGDGSGNLTIFDLNQSFEHPASEPTNILYSGDKEYRPSDNRQQVSITKLLWSPNGKQIIVGHSDGKISIFHCPVYDSVDTDFHKFEAIIQRKIDSNDR